MIPTGTRALVLQRDGHRCARCGRSVLDFPASVHHRVPRRMGGTRDPRIDDPRNLVLLCGSGATGCHGDIESHRTTARFEGWLLSSHDLLASPLVRGDGTAFALTEDGGRYDITAEVSRDSGLGMDGPGAGAGVPQGPAIHSEEDHEAHPA